jgi:hypothetical protein
MNMEMKDLQDKITDFSRFGMVLLAVSVFLFIGTLIPSEDKAVLQTNLMMISTIFFLGIAFFFFRKVASYKKQLIELDEKK